MLPLVAVAAIVVSPVAQSKLPAQSPVNVVPEAIQIDPTHPKLDVTYGHSELELEYKRKDDTKPDGCQVRDHEETEEAKVKPGSGFVTAAGVRYDLDQFHFHTPAEHRFAGRQYPLEMHLVHRSAAGKLLVVGVPLRAGEHSVVDTVLAKLAPECGQSVHIPSVNLNSLLPHNKHTLHYQGSLTTHPFTEGVQWYLAGEKTVSQATLSRFQGLFSHGNSRAVQPLNGRHFTEVGLI
ncbi:MULTISPECIES: carbonic anhydrase family protein [unclassified Crossiella]|uniref:carbonic anhydrase family protein n=1 Tax=unclassified Crossiella TaxID=2620835 RepID=UPI001FFE8E76|nr:MULTISPECIES: carbonic anhydrase family protein [unclassified Crossiella]MCK2243509.1 carbonic anhydrase family protein [Crossiella sp. S99.2]MCK2257367.1 carbonic anhydrase family protein [Crossiella sp. S99.1]